MKNAFSTIAIACALAFGSFAQGQDRSVADLGVIGFGQHGEEVVEYNIGVKPAPITDPDAKVEVAADPDVAPEGFAETLVVISGPGCTWCDIYKTSTLKPLLSQGYHIEIYDMGKPGDKEKLRAKYSNIKYGKDSTAVNQYRAYPTSFYIRGDQIIKKSVGYKTGPEVRKTLWKADKKEDNVVESVRKRFPWNK